MDLLSSSPRYNGSAQSPKAPLFIVRQSNGRGRNLGTGTTTATTLSSLTASTPGCSRLDLFPVPPGASGETDQK